MATDHSARIAEIRAILESGVRSHTTDGQTTSYDLDSLRRELSRLEQEDQAARSRKPRVSRMLLG